jgi:hypothetical protein
MIRATATEEKTVHAEETAADQTPPPSPERNRDGADGHAEERLAASENDVGADWPAEVMDFLGVVFAPGDHVLFRPIEMWADKTTDDGTVRRTSRPLWQHTRCLTLGASGWKDGIDWSALLQMAEHERAHLFYGVCPRFGGGRQV